MHGPTAIKTITIFADIVLFCRFMNKLPDWVKILIVLTIIAVIILIAITARNKYVAWHNSREEKRQRRN